MSPIDYTKRPGRGEGSGSVPPPPAPPPPTRPLQASPPSPPPPSGPAYDVPPPPGYGAPPPPPDLQKGWAPPPPVDERGFAVPPAHPGQGGLVDRGRLVFRQKAKVIELTNEFKILDEGGQDIGFVREEGQSKMKKVARFVTSLDQFMTHTLVVYEPDGRKVLSMTRPRKLMKSRLIVEDAAGDGMGEIVQRNVFGKIRFGLMGPRGQELGEIRAENWRAWNFAIVDHTGTEVARITKTWEGFARTLFTTADHYVLEIAAHVVGPLRYLALASAAGVDTALKQDSRGLG